FGARACRWVSMREELLLAELAAQLKAVIGADDVRQDILALVSAGNDDAQEELRDLAARLARRDEELKRARRNILLIDDDATLKGLQAELGRMQAERDKLAARCAETEEWLRSQATSVEVIRDAFAVLERLEDSLAEATQKELREALLP